MLRHLKNSQELVLYASLSCGAGFLARLVPAFYVPILLLRLGILAYCFVILYRAEGQKELAILIGSALAIGFVGANLDLLEIEVKYNLPSLVARITTVLVFGALAGVVRYQLKTTKK
jgi:hypothetical protein